MSEISGVVGAVGEIIAVLGEPDTVQCVIGQPDMVQGSVDIHYSEFPEYGGVYNVVPSVVSQQLETENRLLRENILVTSIPYSEAANPSGGNTVTIGV